MSRDSDGHSVVVKPRKTSSTDDNDSSTEPQSSDRDSDNQSSRDMDKDDLSFDDLRPTLRTTKSGAAERDESAFVSDRQQGHKIDETSQSQRRSSDTGNKRSSRHSTPHRAARHSTANSNRDQPSSSETLRRGRDTPSHSRTDHERKYHSDLHRSHPPLPQAPSTEDSETHYHERSSDHSRSRSPKKSPSVSRPSDDRRREKSQQSDRIHSSNRQVQSKSTDYHANHHQPSGSSCSQGRGRDDTRRSSLSPSSNNISYRDEHRDNVRHHSPSPCRTTKEGPYRNHDGQRSISPRFATRDGQRSGRKDSTSQRRPRSSSTPPQRNVETHQTQGHNTYNSDGSARHFMNHKNNKSTELNGSVDHELNHRHDSRLPSDSRVAMQGDSGELLQSKSNSYSQGSSRVQQNGLAHGQSIERWRQRESLCRGNDEPSAEMHESVGSLSISDLENFAYSPTSSRAQSTMLNEVLEPSRRNDFRKAFSMGDLGLEPCRAKSILRAGKFSPYQGGQESCSDSSGNSVSFTEAAVIIPENEPVKKDRFKSKSPTPKQIRPKNELLTVHATTENGCSRDILTQLLRCRDSLDEPLSSDEPAAAFEDIWNDDESSAPHSLWEKRTATAIRLRGDANPSTARCRSPQGIASPQNVDSWSGANNTRGSSPSHPVRAAVFRAPTPPRQMQMSSSNLNATRTQGGRTHGPSNGRPPVSVRQPYSYDSTSPTKRVSPPSYDQGARQSVAIKQLASLGGSLRHVFGQTSPSNSHHPQMSMNQARSDERSEIAAFVRQVGSAPADPKLTNRAERPGLPRAPNVRPNSSNQQQQPQQQQNGLGGSLRNIFGQTKSGNRQQTMPPSAAAVIRMAAADTRMAMPPRSPPSSSDTMFSARSRAPPCSSDTVGSANRSRAPPSSSDTLGSTNRSRAPPSSSGTACSGWGRAPPSSSETACSGWGRVPPTSSDTACSGWSRASRPGLFKSQSARLNVMLKWQPPHNGSIFGNWDPNRSKRIDPTEEERRPSGQNSVFDHRTVTSFTETKARPPRSPPTSSSASDVSAGGRISSRPRLFKSQSVRTNQVQQPLPPPRNVFGHIDRSRRNSISTNSGAPASPVILQPPEVSPQRFKSASEIRMLAAHSAFASNASSLAYVGQGYPRVGEIHVTTRDPRAVTTRRAPSSGGSAIAA